MMSLLLSPDQAQTKDMAERFFREIAPISEFRQLRDTKSDAGYLSDTWRQMRELGLPAAPIPEEASGIGIGYVGLGTILEASGRTLTASPLFSAAALGASAVMLGGPSPRRDAMLGQIACGASVLALAFNEGWHHAPDAITTRATWKGDHYLVDGRKTNVIDARSADRFIVTARDERNDGELIVLLVNKGAPGLKIEPVSLVDSRAMAHVTFNDVKVAGTERLDQGYRGRFLDDLLDRAYACLAAEMLGGIDELFERTLRYVCDREQFGVKIGSFQALKHRLARLFIDIELTRSAIRAALSAIDAGSDELPRLASIAKARANDTALSMSAEAVQMHGGIAMTDDLDVGLFLKRLRVTIELFGSSRYHRDRYASLAGY